MNDSKSLTIVPRTLPEVQSMAEVLAQSSLMPKELVGKVPDVVVRILAGQELGLSPMASIRGVHIVQGKPILSADTMVALVLASGSCEYFQVESETDTAVTYVCQRRGAPSPQRYTWTDEDTKLAGLNTKDNWRLHKKQMRRARCKAILARDSFPDVLAGVYEADSGEIDVPRTAPPPPPPIIARVEREPEAVDAEVVVPSDLLELVNATTTLGQLEALKDRCAAIPDGTRRTEVRKAYAVKLKAFDHALKAEPAA